MYTCIIVEDEELPRLSLKSKLETYHPDIDILAMCEDAESALEIILRNKPQFLFLDIQLPGQNSMWLLEQLQKTGKLPQIIFTTAYTDPGYLLKAIKFSATDYLNKPISIVELAQAVEKAKKRIQEEKEIKQASQKKYFRSAHSIHSLSHRMMISSLLKLMVIMHKYNCSTAKRS
jgi:two-component system LytT family response regulator